MSVFAPGAPQIWAMEPRACRSQFHADYGARPFRFVSRRPPLAKRRDGGGVPVSRIRSGRATAQGKTCRRDSRDHAFVHCVRRWRRPPALKTIARGKALSGSGRQIATPALALSFRLSGAAPLVPRFSLGSIPLYAARERNIGAAIFIVFNAASAANATWRNP